MGRVESALARIRRNLSSGQDVARLTDELNVLRERVAELEREPHHPDALLPTMAWVEQATLTREPLISVVTPTRNRASALRRAAGSVLAQTYPAWELLIVDDASSDATPDVIADLQRDQRIRTTRVEAGSAAGARNAGLELADGEVIAYLDDDNTMHPGWLKAVAWAFEQRPEAQLLYGAFVFDDFLKLAHLGSGAWPGVAWNQFDRETLVDRGLTDISALAHRSGLEGARFDESLVSTADWDMLARLTVDREPLVVPAIASFYYTDAPDRLSKDGAEPSEANLVRSRARAAHRRWLSSGEDAP